MQAKPMYQVDPPAPCKVRETVMERVEITDAKGKGTGKFRLAQTTVEKEYPSSRTVYFLQGHVTRFLTEEDMNAAGVYDGDTRRVDPDTGLTVDGRIPQRSLKDKALARVVDRTLNGA